MEWPSIRVTGTKPLGTGHAILITTDGMPRAARMLLGTSVAIPAFSRTRRNPLELEPDVRFVVSPDGIIVFSGAQLSRV